MLKIICYFLFIFLVACQTVPPKKNQAIAKINIELGLSYLKEKQIARAKEKLLMALQAAPTLPETQLALGYFYLETHHIALAKSCYNRALQLAPQSARVQNNYGIFLCRTGHYRESIGYFKKAASDPKYLAAKEAEENEKICLNLH